MIYCRPSGCRKQRGWGFSLFLIICLVINSVYRFVIDLNKEKKFPWYLRPYNLELPLEGHGSNPADRDIFFFV